MSAYMDAIDSLPEGPFNVANGRGFSPFTAFDDERPDAVYTQHSAPPILPELAAVNLERFVKAQGQVQGYTTAMVEMTVGRKRSHWIWYVFPQMAGLASNPSHNSAKYAIGSLAEAVEYLRHPVLGPRLRELTGVVLASKTQAVLTLMGSGGDTLKLQSCMTLFAVAAGQLDQGGTNQAQFKDVLRKYFGGKPCVTTLNIVG